MTGTVQFWHCWDGPRMTLVDGLIAEMEARYPSIKVESEVGDAASARERLVTALASGSPPNAVMLKSDSIAFFAERGDLVPLDHLLARDGIAHDWFPSAELASRLWGGQLFGLPQTTDRAQHLLFVNLGLLEKIGFDPARPLRTWQDLDALVEPAGKAGLLVMDPGRIGVGTTAHQVWTYANGGRYWDGDLTRITWTQPASVTAAEWLVQFVRHQAGDDRSVASGGDPRTPLSVAEWSAERYICCVNGAEWLFELQHQGQRIRYAVYEAPRNAESADSHGETPGTGGWTLAIPRAAPEHEAAWEWLKLATASASACSFVERQQLPSPLVGCDERGGLQATHPFWSTLSASLAKSVPMPGTPIRPQLEQIYRRMQDEMLQTHRTPADALESAARDAQQLLDKQHARRKRN